MDDKGLSRVAVMTLLGAVLVAVLPSLIYTLVSFTGTSHTPESLIGDVEPSQKMLHYRKVTSGPRIIKVTERIRVATGFALGNVILVEAEEGMIIVDTTECMTSAESVYKRMREYTNKPVKAIVYTHNHADHTNGAKAFCVESKPESMPQIWAHHSFERELNKFVTVRGMLMPRSLRQFGTYLPDHLKAGMGGELLYKNSILSCYGMIQPTNLIHQDIHEVNIAGLDVHFIHIPGETDDQIGVWIPGEKAFLAADDIYQAFPNLYAIRGTPIRDAIQWLDSLDKIREMRATHLVPSHGEPLSGVKHIYETLTVYRDGIQYVHDQTVRYMNQGLYPQDIALRVKLPPVLRDHPYLAELYGTLEWSVRAIFNQYVGWFGGNIAELHAIGTTDTAQRMVRLAGGWDQMVQESRRVLEEGDAKWALTLTSQLFVLNPQDEDVLNIRLKALKQLARAIPSPNGRNYYLTTALEDFKLVDTHAFRAATADAFKHMTIKRIFTSLRMRLRQERVDGVHLVLLFNFTDSHEIYTITVRHNIMEVKQAAVPNVDLHLTLNKDLWLNILTKKVSINVAQNNGSLIVDGQISILQQFLSYFE